jgi:hypothetical protein
LRRTDVAGIADLPPLADISYDEFDAGVQSIHSSDLGGAEGQAPTSFMQTELWLKQFVKRIGKSNFGAFNKWKKVWVAGFREKKYWSIIPATNHLKQFQDRPLHR